MRAQGHTTVWGTHRGVHRATDTNRWYQQLKAWWGPCSRASAATIGLRDAPRETFTPRRQTPRLRWSCPGCAHTGDAAV